MSALQDLEDGMYEDALEHEKSEIGFDALYGQLIILPIHANEGAKPENRFILILTDNNF